MKQKKTIATLAIAGAIITTHHSTPNHTTKTHKENTNSREITLLASQDKTIGQVTNTSFLHFRSGPTTNDSIIRTLNGSQKMIVLGTYGDWYKVNIDGTIGYVYSYYVKIINNANNNSNNQEDNNIIGTGSLINTTFLHLRTSDSIYSDVITTLNTSSKIEILAKDGTWYKVKVDGEIGYVYGYYLQLNSNIVPNTPSENNNNPVIQDNSGTGHLINTTFLHFRSAATLDSDIISTLNENSKISVIKKVGSWYEVKVDGQVGYVYGYYLSVTTNPTPDNNTKPDDKPVTPTPEISGIGTGSLINTTFLHLRDRATTDSNIIETLYDNDKIVVLAKDGAWYKVNVNGQVGYVDGYYLNVNYNNNNSSSNDNSNIDNNSNIVVGQVINSPYLHVRAGAGTNFSILEDIYRGDKVEVIKKLGDWYEIKINGKIGYVYNYYLEIISGNLSDNKPSDNTKPENNKPSIKVEHGTVVGVSSLNVRQAPSTNSKILGTLNKNDVISIISGKDGWFKILYKGQEAYVSANYIKITDPYEDTETESSKDVKPLNATGIINAYVANIRVDASTSSAIIAQETLNSPITITGEKGDFYQIKLGNKFGFVSKKLVLITKESEGSNPNNNQNDDNQDDNKVPSDNTTQITTNYPISLNDYVNLEYQNWPLFSKEEFLKAINPLEINNMFEFLRIDQFRNVNLDKLNKFLAGKGVLSGEGQAFVNACKKYNIDPVYFVNQSILETGYGRSKLAKGITISEIALQSKPIYNGQGQLVGYHMQKLPHPVTVYNLFGIGADDNSSAFPNRALVLGTTYAYTHGWTSIASAISGAAEFVSSNYIHNSYYAQNTVYKLRFSPKISSIWHQYSTNVWYSRQLAELMNEHMNIYSTSDHFNYDVPVFKS